jgi:hypothetical protein
MIDPLEAEMMRGAVAALRRRAERQRQVAAVHGDRSGEAAIAGRLAEVLSGLADEFARALARGL